MKFVTKEDNWQHDKFVPKMIMDAMNIDKDEREIWWKEEGKDAKTKFNRRRNNCGRKIREVMEGKPIVVARKMFLSFSQIVKH